jgi:hypothetical protein
VTLQFPTHSWTPHDIDDSFKPRRHYLCKPHARQTPSPLLCSLAARTTPSLIGHSARKRALGACSFLLCAVIVITMHLSTCLLPF